MDLEMLIGIASLILGAMGYYKCEKRAKEADKRAEATEKELREIKELLKRTKKRK